MFRFSQTLTMNLVIATLIVTPAILGGAIVDQAIAGKTYAKKSAKGPTMTMQKMVFTPPATMQTQQPAVSGYKMPTNLAQQYANSRGKRLISTGNQTQNTTARTIRKTSPMYGQSLSQGSATIRRFSGANNSLMTQAIATTPKTNKRNIKSFSGNSQLRSMSQGNYQQLSEALRRNNNAITGNTRSIKRYGNASVLGSSNFRRLSDALRNANANSSNSNTTATAGAIRRHGNASVLGGNNFRRLADALGNNDNTPGDMVPRSGEGDGSPRGHNVGLFDRRGDSIAEVAGDKFDSIRDAFERIGEADDDDSADEGPFPEGGEDERGPASSDDGPITDGGADERGGDDADDGPITDGGADERGPASDPADDGGHDDAHDGGHDDGHGDDAADDGGHDGDHSGHDGGHGHGGHGHGHHGGAVGDVLGILDMLGHGVPFHGHRWHHWTHRVHVPAQMHVHGGVVIPANTLPMEAVPETKTIVIVNPAATNQPINFLLDGQAKTLDEEQVLELSTVEPMVIRFDRGGQFGPAEYTLTEGIYEFRLTDAGWDIVRRNFAITLDNSQNTAAFNYIADGEQMQLAAGETRKHRGRFPIAIEFDRGDGQPAELMLPSGVYRIGLNSETELLDLQLIPEADEL